MGILDSAAERIRDVFARKHWRLPRTIMPLIVRTSMDCRLMRVVGAMSGKLCCILIACLLAVTIERSLQSADPDAASVVFFEKQVRPVLANRCYDCHGAENAESGLRVDSLAGLLTGGKRGAAIVVGQSRQSLMISAINHADQLHMPPKTKISTVEILSLTAWVDAGALWPNAPAVVEETPKTLQEPRTWTQRQRQFWSFQPPQMAALPHVPQQWDMTSPVDPFVQRALAAAGLIPAARATKRVLLRRAMFDLTGLPPTISELEGFLEDTAPDSFEQTLDRLLASPRYGERWGRHWLDVARYADSNGLDENLAYGNAFRYRDYVVAAFNKDKPYDRFVVEQLAGDRLADEDPAALHERLTATGFLSLGAKMLAEDDPVKMQMDIVDEQLDTVGRAFMGLTLGCARCHDHKFDPISTAEYYALAGIFKSTATMENFKVVARWKELPLASPAVVTQQEMHQAQITTTQQEILRQQEQVSEEILAQARRHLGDYLLAAARVQRLAQLLARAKVYGAEAETTAPLGAVRIEAENFDRGNVQKDFKAYGAGIGVLVNQGQLPNFVEYDIEVERAGTYQVEIRYAAATPRPCLLIVNGTTVKVDAAGHATGSWTPESQRWFVEGFFALSAGKNVLRLQHPKFFPHIDKLMLVPVQVPAVDQGVTPPLASDYRPKQQLIRRCVEFLDRSGHQPNSLFAAWHAQLAGEPLAALKGDAARFRDRVVGDVSPESPRDLALLYQEKFGGVDRPSSAPHTDEKEKPDENSDDTTFERAVRAFLFGATGPFAEYETSESDYPPAVAQKLKQLRATQQELEKERPQIPHAMAVSDGNPEDLRIHIRGSHVTLGERVPRRFPSVLSKRSAPKIGDDRSGRLQMARWLASEEHPLTARVMVNRIWQGHFGKGLVRSPDNFGRLGERPDHPALLDYLAVRFAADGWSIKAMHRLLMTSATWQMSTVFDARAATVDPENRLLWRMERRRLEAELIRDAVLVMGDSLELTMGGSLLPTKNRSYVTSTANVDPVSYMSIRRSVYLPVVRSALFDLFQAFDFADPSYLRGQRQTTTVAPQALFVMNSKLVADQMRLMATGLLDREIDDPQRVQILFLRAFGRRPSSEERQESLTYIERYIEAVGDRVTDHATLRLQAWQSLCRAIVSANEFIYIE